jgi:hypothetical protein
MTRPTANRRCASEGCTRPLTGRWPHPLCPECHDTAEAAAARPGTRKVLVYTPTTTTIPHFTAVTLPVEPWEATP